jgi:hypothetical protein
MTDIDLNAINGAISDAYRAGVQAAANNGDDGSGWDDAGLRAVYEFGRTEVAKLTEEREEISKTVRAISEWTEELAEWIADDEPEEEVPVKAHSIESLIAAVRVLSARVKATPQQGEPE